MFGLRDRRDLETSRYPTVSGGRQKQSQRNLLIGVGVFVVAIIVVGVLLLSGGDDNDDNDSAALATNTSASSPAASGSEMTAEPAESPTDAEPQSTTGTGQIVATATAGRVIPTVTPADPPTAAEETSESDATEETTDDGPEATETTGADDEPTEEPIIGDFGQLPPVQIVSGGLERNVDLTYELDAASFAAPDTATVYEVQWLSWSADEIATIAANIGMDGEVEDLGAGSFQVNGAEAGLYIGPSTTGQSILQYESYAEPEDEPLPDNGSLIELGYSFLVDNGILGGAGDGVVLSRDDDFGVAVVDFKPADPAPILAAYPGATVTFGPGGLVKMADVRWAGDYAASDYGLRSTNALWNDVLAGEASLDADLSELPDGALTGTFTVTDIGIAYSLAGADYLAPLVVFYGDAYFADYDVSVPMRIYVQAVAGQDTPSG
jgi:hypothetical protein